MRTAARARSMIRDVMRIHRQMRRLNAAYMNSEDKRETAAVLQACVSELTIAHSLLPAELRSKSWFLSVERYPA